MDAEQILGSMVRSALSGNRRRRRPRRASGFASSAGSAIGMGLMGLAIGAWEHYSQKQAAGASVDTGAINTQSVPPIPPPLPSQNSNTTGDGDAVLLVRAMVAAANADWSIDAEERQRIMGEIGQSGLGAEERKFLEAEISQPISMDALVAQVTRADLAEQVYLASMLAVQVDSEAEKGYLKQLAGRLGLAPETISKLEAQLDG